ncbi:MAG TPA: PEP-CTERM sorting domain-containing protein [Pyrinomonadaceae bacterium]|nr:PEP-CTERM sorting domain-containing protein [Pyrinomonadaceae bacterium]
MSRFIRILVLAVFLCVPAFVKADPLIVINFDDPSPAPLETYRAQGVVFSTILLQPTGPGCPLFDQQCTVVGTINDIALRTSPAAVSPPQGAFPVTIDPSSGNINGILITFAFEGSQAVPSSPFTWMLNVIGSQGGQWHILVFNESSTNIFDLTTGLTSHIVGTFDRSFAATMDSAQTHHIIFIPSSQNGPEGIDNFQFTATEVPEPASMLLLSLGIGGLLGLKKRNQRSR